MKKSAQDMNDVLNLVQAYFHGLHNADTAALEQIFDPQVILMAPGLRRDRDEWLNLVANRPIPAEAGYPFGYRVLAVEIMGQQAMVKVSCPLLDKHYMDYLGLLKEGGRWSIVTKMYADFPAHSD